MSFVFNPPTGLNDETIFPDEDALIRSHLQGLLQQLASGIDLKVNQSDFTSGGTTTNGWRKNLVSGEIVQWGAFQTNTNTDGTGKTRTTVTFPIAFDSFDVCIPTIHAVDGGSIYINLYTANANSNNTQAIVTTINTTTSTAGSNIDIKWIAIGK